MNEQPDPFQYKMVIDYFDNHKAGKFKLNDLCYDFIARYNFTAKRERHGDDIFKAVQKDIASVLNDFYNVENHFSSQRNFHREETKDGYIYNYLLRTNNYVLPKVTSSQLALDFELKEQQEIPLETNTTMEENCPLLDDIRAADSINKERDVISLILDNYNKMNIYNLEEITFITTIDNKKITINIADL